MDKNKKNKLMRVFDNICRNKQYVHYFEGCRIISYNNPETEEIIIQFQHRFNNVFESISYSFNEIYTSFELENLCLYYEKSIEIAIENIKNKL